MALEVILFILVIVAGTGGELCISRAMKSFGEMHDFSVKSIAKFLVRSLRLPLMRVGLVLVTTGFLALLALFSFQEVSFVVPISSLNCAAGAFGAKAFLGERISRNRWIGIATVFAGVTIVWWSTN